MIRAREVRVVGDKGEQMGVLPIAQAREVAEKLGLDLVEVAPTAVPPVCRLMDYGKFKYTQTKREKENRKSQKVTEIREIRVRPKIGDHDFDAKARTARKLLEGGDKVKVTVMFRGRENTHSELGIALIEKMAERGVATNVHYKPMPMMTAYKALGWDIKDFPNTYDYYHNLITLPFHTKLTDEDVEYVCETLKEIVNEIRR